MTYSGHTRAILSLGLPLIGGHLAQFAIGLTDTVMLGWYGVGELAAVTLAGSYFFVLFMLGSGFGLAVMPMVAAAAASNDDTSVRRITRMGLWLSLGYACLAVPLMIWSEPILLQLGQSPDVAALASKYLQLAGWGLFPALLVMTLKSYLAALERTKIVLWITLAAALTNGVANYVLIFGKWGFPELGITGAAIASVVTQVISIVAVVIYAIRVLPEHSMFQRFWRPDWEMLAQVSRLGLPIGLTLLSEVTLFSASALMMGWLGKVPLAAHGIVAAVSGGTFMVHLGLANVATIRAGNAYGRKDRAHLADGARVVIAISLVYAVMTIALFVLAPEPLLALFLDQNNSKRSEILGVGVGLLAVAALFQLVDGAQVIALGLLRGVQDTKVPMVMAVLSYWAIGIPASYFFGFVMGMEGIGIWLGLVCGLACAGVFLMARFWGSAIGKVGQSDRYPPSYNL